MNTPPPLPEGVEPPTQAELDRWRAEAEAQNAYIAAQDAARAAREAALAAPLTPQPIEGTTVEEVKASAEASLADLAIQMQDRLQLLAGG